MDEKIDLKTKLTYSMTGLGRDLIYTLYSTYLLVFLTSAIGLSDFELGAVAVVIALSRVWDAVNDPMMGILIDNTKTKFGKFRPWIGAGALTAAICIFLLFQDFGLRGVPFVVVFTILYLLVEITYTINDIAYWSMYPSFSSNQKERESIGALARIFASLGMFITVGLVPIIYPNFPGGPKRGFFFIALIFASIFLISQMILVFTIKEKKNPIVNEKQEKTKLKDLLKIIFKNDQLVVIIISVLLFNIGYFTTTSLGIYFFEYDFNKYGGIEFTIFSVILAVSTVLALVIFPRLVKKYTRRQLYTASIILMSMGYILMMSSKYLLPQNMITLGTGGFFLFFGQGFNQVLILVLLADTIEYGQWKLGTRNESVVFSINPFVVKMATSIQTLIVAGTLIFSGLNDKVINPLANLMGSDAIKNLPGEEKTVIARDFISANITDQMTLILRLSMIIIPLICILVSYVVYMKYYKIDKIFYDQMIHDINERNKNNA